MNEQNMEEHPTRKANSEHCIIVSKNVPHNFF